MLLNKTSVLHVHYILSTEFLMKNIICFSKALPNYTKLELFKKIKSSFYSPTLSHRILLGKKLIK